jgi:hypothetical protein
VLANVARGAAALGDRTRFEDAWSQVWEGVDEGEAPEGAAEALVELARGAASLADWERAEKAAARALEVATGRGEAKARLSAETVLESARGRTATEASPVPGREAAADEADALAAELVRSLSQASAAG